MKRMKSRVLALLLSAAMVITMIPAEPVMAAGSDGTAAYSVQTGISDEEISSEENIGKDETEQGSTEPVEGPTEEPAEEEPTEEPAELPTEEPAELPTEEPSEEPTEEPAETPSQEPAESPSQEPTQTPAEEVPSESPTKTPEEILPSESPTATPDELMPTETPTATATPTPSAELPKEGEWLLFGIETVDGKAVGSDGIMYADVAYLSVKAVSSLSEDMQEQYLVMCDTIAEIKESGEDVQNIVISVNKSKELELSMFMPLDILYTEDMQEQFLNTEEEDASLADEDNKEESLQESEETIDTNDQEEETEPSDVPDENVEEKPEEDNASVEEETEAGDETEVTEAEEKTEETGVTEVTDLPEKAEEKETKPEAVSENLTLAASYAVSEETFETEPFVELDTLITNENYFKNQLTSFEKTLYDSGKSALVKKGSNTFSIRTSVYPSVDNFANAISALINTYPNRFNWMDRGTGGFSIYYRYSGGKYTFKTVITKSKHYSKSLETSANKKVSALVKEATEYAAATYPSCPAYGMIEYFDKWICENNYYNNTGTATDLATRKGSTYFYCHSVYGILLKGYGVCESYALTMSRLLDAAGIRNLYVVGDAGGGHAWNYVQMPDGKWYLLDSTWNDGGRSSSKEYFLVKDDGVHTPTGKGFGSGKNFTFYGRNSANYKRPSAEPISLNITSKVLKTKEKVKLSLKNSYYDKFAKTWSSSNTKIVKVDKNGNVTAGTTPGKATITCKIAGKTATCTVCVYQFTNLTFSNNKKTSFKATYENPDTAFNASDIITLSLAVNQKNKALTAQTIKSSMALANPTATSNKKTVADVSSVSLSGDTITLKVQPKAVGTAKITVKFAGKSATYTVTVKQKLQTAWFNFSKVPSSVEYSGKAFKPAVLKATSAPKNVKYTVSYKNNTNAGTATITLKGTGSYCSTVTKTFTIRPKSITTAVFSSCTASVKYNGKAQVPSTKVKLGKKTLKVNKEYTIAYYKGNKKLSAAPTAVGQYTVRITGKGNYSGTVTTAKTFEIKPYSFDKVTVSCSTTVKYTGKAVNPVKVKIGKNVLTTSDYAITYYNVATGAKLSSAPSAKGKYKAVITPKGANVVKGKKASVTKTFTIK